MLTTNKAFLSVDGHITPLTSSSTIPALDRGWLLGDRLIETVVAYHGRIWQFDEHYARIHSSAQRCSFPWIWQPSQILRHITDLLSYIDDPEVFVRLIITPGEGFGLRRSSPASSSPHLYLYAFPRSIMIHHEAQKKGLTLHLTDASPGAVHNLKTAHYLPAISALHNKTSLDDILWTHGDSVCESSTGNVFFIKESSEDSASHRPQLLTPSLDQGILPGLTRQALLRLARQTNQYEVLETSISLDDLSSFTECWLTSTVQQLTPVRSITPHSLKTLDSPKSHYHRLSQIFDQHIKDWIKGY